MATHQQHHFVPRFLLERWQEPRTGKLTQFRWAGGQLRNNRYTAQHVAKVRHLYSSGRNQVEPDVGLEHDFLGPEIDQPASLVLTAILNVGIETLTDEQAETWTRFLIAQHLRVPPMVEHMRVRGREVLTDALNAQPEEYQRFRGDASESTLVEWLQARAPDEFDDLAIKALPGLVNSELLQSMFKRSHWAVMQLKKSVNDLLIGDRPLLRVVLGSGSQLWTLPLSPRHVFMAYTEPAVIKAIAWHRPGYIARAINHETVRTAMSYVYATGRSHESLIRRYLRKQD